ncbi:hypothetical protein OC844_007136, partial [Tilletia horrida]
MSTPPTPPVPPGAPDVAISTSESAPPSFSAGAAAPSTPGSSPARRAGGNGPRSSKRRKAPDGGDDHLVLSATEREEKYARVAAAGMPAALELIRSQDELISDLRAALARADASASSERADRKAILGAIDILAASVRDVKAAVQAPEPRASASTVPSAVHFQPTLASIAARSPPARQSTSPPASAPGFGRPTPAAMALSAALQRPRAQPATPVDALRAAVRGPRASSAASTSRSQLGKDDFALLHIRNLRSGLVPGAVRQVCSALGVDAAHIHDV